MVRKRNIFIIFVLAIMATMAVLFTNMSPPPERFVELCYLERYPDVAEKWVENGLVAEDHYLKYGKSQNRIPGCDGLDYNKLRAQADLDALDDAASSSSAADRNTL